MSQQGQKPTRKSHRKGAGVHQGRDENFVWNSSELGNPQCSSTIVNKSTQMDSLIDFENVSDCDITITAAVANRPETAKSIHSTSTFSKSSSRSKRSLEKKRLEITLGAAKKNQGINQELRICEIERKRLEEEKAIVQLQQDLELIDCEESDDEQEDSIVDKASLVKSWIGRLDGLKESNEARKTNENNAASRPENIKHTNSVEKAQQPVEKNSSTEAKPETLAAVLSATNEGFGIERYLTRQVMGKDMPTFDGKPENWPLFIARYRSIVTQCNYSNDEILSKLHQCLRGDALASVKGMLLHPSNVSTIIKTLEKRFGRSEFIIETMLNELECFPNIKDSDFETLINLSCKMQNMIAVLEQLEDGVSYLQNPQLIKKLYLKLPTDMKLRWGENVRLNNGKTNLKQFATWLDQMSDAACYVFTPKSVSNVRKLEVNFRQRKENVLLVTGDNHPCGYCGEDGHKAAVCPKMQFDSVDERWGNVVSSGLCFLCLCPGHHSRNCNSRNRCNIQGCKIRHHSLLHKNILTMPSTERFPQQTEETIGVLNDDQGKVLMRILPVKLYGHNGSVIETFAYLDDGSSISLIQADVVEKLGIVGENYPLCMRWTDENFVLREDDSKCVDIEISGIRNYSKKFKMTHLRTTRNLLLPRQTLERKGIDSFPHLSGLPVNEMFDARPTILIGQDNIDLTIARRVVECRDIRAPIATKTRLGWVIHGPTGAEFQNEVQHTLAICHFKGVEFDNRVEQMIKASYSTEAFGVKPLAEKVCKDNLRAKDILEKTTRRLQDRFETGLLWLNDDLTLPESRGMAYNRLLNMERKMQRDESFAEQYHQKMESYERKGYIRKLSPEESNERGPRTWYLPHFGVVHPHKKKLRLVFDAASKSHGVSLNDNLIQGPDLLQPLPAVLMRFREKRFGYCGDITEMFHQVKVRKEDQSSQRLLWRTNRKNAPDEYEMQVLTFGSTCSPCSAQYVKNWNAKMSSEFPNLIDEVERNFYMDDYLGCSDSERDALERIERMTALQKTGGFDLVNWISNSPAVMKKYASDKAEKNFDKENDNEPERILGLWWDAKNDYFTFKISFHRVPNEIVSGKIAPTKRQVLRLMMSVFDPLGFLGHFIVRARILFQMIWRSGIDWDDEIPQDLQHVWIEWLNDLQKIRDVRIPRAYSYDVLSNYRLEVHIFCDASADAFAAVAYLRMVRVDNFITVSFLISKSRVAPLKPLSIPRLELQAAVMGSRIIDTIKRELRINISKLRLWSDSKTVVQWIKGDGRTHKPFESHRIGEIQELTNPEDWEWIPGKLNVADEATRMTTKVNLDPKGKWFTGPDFLYLEESEWPKFIQNSHLEEGAPKCETISMVGVIGPEFADHYLPDVRRFSKWLRLIRTTAWCLRFVNNFKRKWSKRNKDDFKASSGELTVAELSKAEKKWILYSQIQSFSNDFLELKKYGKVSSRSRLLKLSPTLDEDGLMRLCGRTEHADCMGELAKRPFILDPKHPYTKLLTQRQHEQLKHQGLEMVLNELRQRFWILKARSSIRKTFADCQTCKVRKSNPQVPVMGQIPKMRLTPGVKPFTHTGIDYFGPLLVMIGRRTEKRWGVIFTCMVTRAIHLELANSLTTDSAIMAIRRMISRRGHIQNIYSDNGTNFRGACEELRKSMMEIDNNKIQLELSSHFVQWHFNPPGAPHMGGCWERLVGSVKRILYAVLKERVPREEVLYTVFCEAENIVNSRPLTHVSVDPTDPECLTPNHFLQGTKGNIDHPIGKFVDKDLLLRKYWRRSQKLADIFWSRWVREYLPTLTKRSKWFGEGTPINIDDVVVIADQSAPRNSWPLGIVTRLYPGKDGRVRVVDVRTRGGVFRRPVSKLCRLPTEADGERLQSFNEGENVIDSNAKGP